jgi:ClpP class serine protease
MPGLSEWVFLAFLLFTLAPMFTRWRLNLMRLRAIRKLEQARGSRVITLIHRQEAISLLGIPIRRFIDVDDSEQVLRAIRLTPDSTPIDLVCHTPGGLVLASEQIAHALHKHPAKVTVIVPHYAMSGGTMLTLAADEIVMDENAVLGPVDPQLGGWPAASIVAVTEAKKPEDIDDETLIKADLARKAIVQVREFITSVLVDDFPESKARELADSLSSGRWTHDYPLTADVLRNLGLPVSTDLPDEAFDLMGLYPQEGRLRPSVQYIPLPYPERPSAPPAERQSR